MELQVDIDCTGASRGLVIGFVLGLCLAVMRFGPKAATWQAARRSAPAPQPLKPLTERRLVPKPLAAPIKRALTAAPTPAPPPPPAPLKSVAACVGGALSLVVPGRGLSVRLGVLEPLGWPDVFVAGTLNATATEEADAPHWAARSAAALRSIDALAPFAATSVVRQLTRLELAAQLRASPAWAQYQVQIGRGGDGRLRPEDDDPRLWLPTMLSPALGSRLIWGSNPRRRAEHSGRSAAHASGLL